MVEQSKKDSYYTENGYKFLGWQNGWGRERYKEPEYRHCIDSKHKRFDISNNRSGSENTVSCPICKIYWKYDSSG